MNEQTPRDPQQPHASGEHDPALDPAPRSPEQPAAEPATEQLAAAEPARRGRGILRPVLIGSAAALTILAVAGVGMTIADAVGDDDEPGASQSATTAPAPSTDASPAPSGSDDAPAPSGSDDPAGTAAPQPGGAASAEPDALVTAIDTAIAAAGGGAATSIEVEQGGWDVDVRLDDGTEVDVRVLVDGEPVVRADDDDRSSDLPLDPARIADIRDAAIAAAGGGEIRSIESDDEDGAQRFDIEVLVDGDDVDVELAEDLSVLAAER